LNLDVPKPSFANSHARSAFGFQANMAIPDLPQDMDMADDIYEGFVDDTNRMDEDADIVNDEDRDINGGKLDMIHPSFNAFTFFART
jgi:hypothetical protein